MPREDLIQLRGGTAAEWAAANPVLALNEPGLETDTNKVKYGNGVDAWDVLPYASGGAGATPKPPIDADPYANVAALLADQNNQTEDYFYEVTDASGFTGLNDATAVVVLLTKEPGVDATGTEADYIIIWSEEDTIGGSLPPGGTTGQILKKQSAADGDANWEDEGATGINILNKIGSFTLAPGDNGKYITATGFLDKNCVIPSDATENLPIGFKADIMWRNEGRTTIVSQAGVELFLPSDEEAIIKGRNNGITLVKEGANQWGGFGAFNKAGITPATQAVAPLAFQVSQTPDTSIHWPLIYKSSEWPEVTTTKDYFIIWSTAHSGSAGGLYWGEMDAPDMSGFVYNGLIISGDQAETPQLVRVPVAKSGLPAGEELFLFYHTDASETGNGGIQQTRLQTSTGGVLHTATWNDRGRPMGLQAGWDHTGYCRVFYRPNSDDYIAFHLADIGGETGGGDAWYEQYSNDGLNWTLGRRITDSQYGYTHAMNTIPFILPISYNGSDYIIAGGISNDATPCIFSGDQYLRPTTLIASSQYTGHAAPDSYYHEGDFIHVLVRGNELGELSDYYYYKFDLRNLGL